MISTGGTLKAIVDSLKEHGVDVVMAVIILDKTDSVDEISKKLGIRIRTMIRVSAKDGKLSVIE